MEPSYPDIGHPYMPTPKQILAAYTQMNKIIAMCVAGAKRSDINQELNTLSAMTRIRRER